MKIINYDFENIGGLLKVLAVPPSSFLRVRKDYVTGLNYLELRNRDSIISLPIYADDTYSFSEDKENGDAGDAWSVRVEGVIPKLSPVNRELLEVLERGMYWRLTETARFIGAARKRHYYSSIQAIPADRRLQTGTARHSPSVAFRMSLLFI